MLSVMRLALEEAMQAGARGEIPVGAVVTDAAGRVVAAAGNEVEQRQDPTAHAEMLVLRMAAQSLGNRRLEDCTLTVTLEPCAMCAQAAAHARIGRIVFGAYDPKSGGVEHGARIFRLAQTHHKAEIIGGLNERECADLLQGFFLERR